MEPFPALQVAGPQYLGHRFEDQMISDVTFDPGL